MASPQQSMRFVPVSSTAAAVNWADSTLIWPCFAVGNTGPLAVDALITTYALAHVGNLAESAVLPAVGNDALGPPTGTLTLPLQVYHGHGLTVVQQRAPVIKTQRDAFATRVIEFALAQRFRQVVFLSSCQSSRRIDAQIFGPQFRFVVTLADSPLLAAASQLAFPALEVPDLEPAPLLPKLKTAASAFDDDDFDVDGRWPRGPSTHPVDVSPADASGIPGSHVLRLCYEKVRPLVFVVFPICLLHPCDVTHGQPFTLVYRLKLPTCRPSVYCRFRPRRRGRLKPSAWRQLRTHWWTHSQDGRRNPRRCSRLRPGHWRNPASVQQRRNGLFGAERKCA